MDAPYHHFQQFAHAKITALQSHQCHLVLRQPPLCARVAVGKEKDRKPVDPPPAVQLKIDHAVDPTQSYLQSPYLFMSCNLLQAATGAATPATLGAALAGTLVSSLHRLKDTENKECAFFIFADLSIKVEGQFALQFNLYEMRYDGCYYLVSIQSDPFIVYGPKFFPGMAESTPLTRCFSDQGVRLRLRKEPRALLRKRGPASDDYVPRTYNKSRSQAQKAEQQPEELDQPLESSQGEPSGSMQLQPTQSSPHKRRPPVGRGYSQQTSEAHSGHSEELSMKRPKTGSEQSQQQSFGEQQGQLESPHRPGTFGFHQHVHYPQQTPPQGTYFQQSPQQSLYELPYDRSPQETNSSGREASFNQRLGTQQGIASQFNTGIQRLSPAIFSSSQLQAQFNQQYHEQMLVSSPQQNIQHGFGAIMSLPDRSQTPSEIGGSSMAPPNFRRADTGPAGFGLMAGVHGDRRNSFDPYPTMDSNFSTGSIPLGMALPRSTSAALSTTSAPGQFQSPYE